MQVIASLHIFLQKYFIAVYKQVTYTFIFVILPQNYKICFIFVTYHFLPNINKADKLLKWKCFCLPQQKQQFDRNKQKPSKHTLTSYCNTRQLFNLSVRPTESSSFLTFTQLTSTAALQTYKQNTQVLMLVRPQCASQWGCYHWEAVQLLINHMMYTTRNTLRQPLQWGFNFQGRFNTLEPDSPYVCMYIMHVCIRMCIENYTHSLSIFQPSKNNVLIFCTLCKCLNILPFKAKSLH